MSAFGGKADMTALRKCPLMTQSGHLHFLAVYWSDYRRNWRFMKRRDFITLLSGAAAAWPLTTRAQQSERVRRIGVTVSGGLDADELDMQARVEAFQERLNAMGRT